MEQYTDDERVEDLKKWWRENGLSIIVGIVFGIAAIFGWRYWVSHRDTQAERVSLAYDAFIEAVEKPDADQARQQGERLLADFPKSSYTVLAMLRLARLAVDSGDQATAVQRLQWVIDHAQIDEIRDIARLRLARVLLAASQLSEAKKLLEGVSTTTLTAEREELRGDLHLADHDPAKARTAYAEALATGGGSPLLRLKLDHLAAPTADTVIAAPAPPPPDLPAEPVSAAPPTSAAPAAPVVEKGPAPAAPVVPADAHEEAPAAPAPAPATSGPPP
jgi:predicted negative regulator of RcsB-dependent stress response